MERASGRDRAPVRVLIVTHTARLGGAELALVRLCNALDPNSVTVRVICFEHGDLTRALHDAGVHVEVLEANAGWTAQERVAIHRWPQLTRFAASGLIHAIRVARRIRELDPEVVQSWTLKSHLVTSLGVPLHQRPLAWYLHDRLTSEYLGTLNRIVLQSLSRVPDAIIANSHSTASTLLRECVIAHPGLAPEQFVDPSHVYERRPNETQSILMLGRISPTKGQLEAIQGFYNAWKVWPNLRLMIVGAPVFGEHEYEATCRSLVAELGLEDAVEFIGQVANPQQYIDSASLLLHTSPVPEPFGQVIAEAMARGLPVVAADAGGVPELMGTGGEFGTLVPPKDPVAIAEAICSHLAQPEDAHRRAWAAYLKARSTLTIEQTATVLYGVWSQLAESDLDCKKV